MEQHTAYLVIVDISGYTGFVRMHRTAMVHAEQIITELMESILEEQQSPLQLDKLQGDAAIFYAIDDGDPGVATLIAEQVQAFFRAFNTLEAELVSCNVCLCDACNQVGGLRLKAILHHGEVILKQMGGSTELGGADIILAHRLLKNHVEVDEYILMSAAFHERAGDLEGLEPHRFREDYDIGSVDVVVFTPEPLQALAVRPSLMQRLRQFLRIEWYGLRRMLLGARASRTFRNLPGRSEPPGAGQQP